MDGDHIAMLDPEVVANNTVDASATIIEILVGEDDKHSILPLLSADKNGITTEELKAFHRRLGEGNDGVVVVGGIGNPVKNKMSAWRYRRYLEGSVGEKDFTHMSWLGFFFFLRMAVAVSFS